MTTNHTLSAGSTFATEQMKSDKPKSQSTNLLARAVASAVVLSEYLRPPTVGLSTQISSVQKIDPKFKEAQRQTTRLKAAAIFESKSDSESEVWTASINNTVSLLNSMASSPFEVPMASLGQNQTASLYINQGGIYGDIEIRGDEIDYYVRTGDGELVQEMSGVEAISPSKNLPTNLLVFLWKHIDLK